MGSTARAHPGFIAPLLPALTPHPSSTGFRTGCEMLMELPGASARLPRSAASQSNACSRAAPSR